jgi:subtilisin family serine protease
MDLKKYVMPILFTLFLLGTGIVIGTDDGIQTGTMMNFSFDLDRDGIDDRINCDEVTYPIWTFLHADGLSSIDEILDDIGETGAQVRRAYDIIPVVSVLFNSKSQVLSAKKIIGVGLIEVQASVVPLMDISTQAVKANPSDEYSPRTARELGMTGEGVTIAVIDTGVDNEHPTFEGAFAAGVDFTAPINTPLNPADGSFDPDDRSGHGTGVASIALGRGDSEGNYRGVAPEAGLIDIKVIGINSMTLNQNSLLDALQWCADNINTQWGDTGYSGVDIVTMSLGTGNDGGAVAQAMDRIVDIGIVVVQGAGNSGGPYDTAGTTWADRSLVVGVVDDQDTVDRSDDEIWPSSTYGPRTDDDDGNPYDELRPDLVAPGVSITFASSSRTSRIQGANGWSSGSGTSYATPLVAGTAALMLQAKSSMEPTANSNPVAKILHRTAEQRGEPYDPLLSSTYNTKYGFGILDAYEAVKATLGYTAVNHRPEITYFAVEPNVTTAGSTCRVRAVAIDIDEEILEYELSVDDGEISGDGPIWDWTAPTYPGKYYFNLAVTDPSGGKDTASAFVVVEEGLPNRPPVITSFKAGKNIVAIGSTTTLRVVAIDQDGDDLTYDYSAERGTVQGTGEEVIYQAPSQPVNDKVTVVVDDGKGGTDSRFIEIDVREVAINSPPVILLATLEPSIINSNTSGEPVVLYVQVEDPDGLEDIEIVLADLTSIGGGSGVELLNDGVDPDVQADDLEFTLKIPDIDHLENGTYLVHVTVYDLGEGSDTASVQLVIDIPSTSSDVKGSKGGVSSTSIIIVVILLILIVLVILGFVISRSRSRKQNAMVQPPQQYPAQYPTGPIGQVGPRFQPVQRR